MAPEGTTRLVASARIAYAAAAANLVAATAMLFLLRPGLPAGGSALGARAVYVSEHTVRWRAGWLLWNVAAISLLAFFVVLAARWRRHAPVLCALALLLAAAGLAADLGAETVYMIVAPDLDTSRFAYTESIAIALTGYLGNGLYTLAGILLTVAGARELPRGLVWFAVPVWTAGLALSAATLGHSEGGQFWSTAILMPLFVVWAALVGRWLSGRAS